jgi:hypothetical protein
MWDEVLSFFFGRNFLQLLIGPPLHALAVCFKLLHEIVRKAIT